MSQSMKDLAAKRKREKMEGRLDARMSVQKTEPDRVGFTIYVKPALRKRLDNAYLMLKMEGMNISRPDFCETILESGLDQYDAMLEQSDLELDSADGGNEGEAALGSFVADD